METQLYFSYSAPLAVVSLLLYLIIFIRYRKGIWHNMPQSNHYGFIYISLVVCSVFAFASHDTYHYMEHYQEMLYYNQIVHVEKFYFWLLQILPHNYYLWRFFIWAPAALILVWAYKRCRLNSNVVGVLLVAFILDNFVITRGALGFAILMLSLSFFIRPISFKIISYVIGGLGLYFALAFHRTIGIYLFFVPIAWLFPLKKGYKLTLIAFPFLYVIVLAVSNTLINNPMVMSMFGEAVDTYFEMEETQLNIIGRIRHVIEYLPYLWLTYALLCDIRKKPYAYSRAARYMAKYSYVLIYVAMLFFMQPLSSWISSRTLHAASFSLAICSAEYFAVNKRTKQDIWMLLFFIMVAVFQYVYNIYDWS